MNADDLNKYQGMLAVHRQLLGFMSTTNKPACIVVRVPDWLDMETQRCTSETNGGVFIFEKVPMGIIIDQARQAAMVQIKCIETELTANGITLPVALST